METHETRKLMTVPAQPFTNRLRLQRYRLTPKGTSLREAGESPPGEQVSEAVSEQVARILKACSTSPQSKSALLHAAGLAKAYLNYKRHIQPLLAAGLLEMTLPEKPNSRLQQYRLTAKGRSLL